MDHKASTRQRILDAALKEFSSKGVSGARVDRIAKRAGVNVRMIYYYFQDKATLYREVNTHATAIDPFELPADASSDLVAVLVRGMYSNSLSRPNAVRLFQWESLEFDGRLEQIANRERRVELVEHRIALLRRAQERNELPADIDVRMLYLVLHSVALVPFAFPALVSLVTGGDPEDGEFRRSYLACIERVAGMIASPPAADTPG